MSQNFQQTGIFHRWAKAIPLLNPFSPGIIWKTDIFKKETKRPSLNGHISKTRTNSESELRFSEGPFNFLQNNVIFCALYLRGYITGGSNPLGVSTPGAAAGGLQGSKA